MRGKIIAGNLIIVLAIGIVGYLFVRAKLHTELERKVDEALPNDQVLFDRAWRLEALEFQSQVEAQGQSSDVRAAYTGLDEKSRRRRAFRAAERVGQWFANPARGYGGGPDIVAIVDDTGSVIARDRDINRLHGMTLVSELQSLRATLRDGQARSDVWNKADENKLLHTVAAAVRNDRGAIVGALVVGYDLSNGLAEGEAKILGRDVAFLSKGKVYSSSLRGDKMGALRVALFGPLKAATNAALTSGETSQPWSATLGDHEYLGITAPLPNTTSASVAYAVIADKTAALEVASALNVWLLLVVLGVLLVLVYGFLVGTSLLRPVEQIEEAVLAVINGNTETRIDVQSAEFGGLAYRINQLINVFTGVAEEDEDGRVSSPPPPPGPGAGADWAGGAPPAAAAAPPASGSGTAGGAGGDGVIDDAGLAASLSAEPADAYNARVYSEYVEAKRAVGEDVSNVPLERFAQRLAGNAGALARKHGVRDVRFRVERSGSQVVLRPVLIR